MYCTKDKQILYYLLYFHRFGKFYLIKGDPSRFRVEASIKYLFLVRKFPALFSVFFWANVLGCPFVLYIYRRATVFFYLLLENFFKEFDFYREVTMMLECVFLIFYVCYMVVLTLVYFRFRGHFFPF